MQLSESSVTEPSISLTESVNTDGDFTNITEPIKDVPNAAPMDTLALIRSLNPYNPKLASKMLYQFRNTPGEIKTAGGNRYKISDKGPWIRLPE